MACAEVRAFPHLGPCKYAGFHPSFFLQGSAIRRKSRGNRLYTCQATISAESAVGSIYGASSSRTVSSPLYGSSHPTSSSNCAARPATTAADPSAAAVPPPSRPRPASLPKLPPFFLPPALSLPTALRPAASSGGRASMRASRDKSCFVCLARCAPPSATTSSAAHRTWKASPAEECFNQHKQFKFPCSHAYDSMCAPVGYT